MGKYATQRKRGSHSGAAAGITPPPPPVLTTGLDLLLQQSMSGSNEDGTCYMYRSDTPEGPFLDWSDTLWAAVIDWEEFEVLSTGYYRATEAGNGVNYEGLSDFSNTVHVVVP